jgi:hypothetical protein
MQLTFGIDMPAHTDNQLSHCNCPHVPYMMCFVWRLWWYGHSAGRL